MSEAFGSAIERRAFELPGYPLFSVRPAVERRKGRNGGGLFVGPAGGRGTHLQGGTVATLAGVDGDDAVERRANAAEAREANLRREGGGSDGQAKVVGHWCAQVLGFICFR